MLWSSNDVTQQGSRPKTKLENIMETLARTLILACKHINDRSNSNSDDDVALLEAIAVELGSASDAEKQSLIESAKLLSDEAWPEEMGIL